MSAAHVHYSRQALEPPPVIALCTEYDCQHWWKPERDDVVPICPADTTEDRTHRVVLYNLDEGHR